MTTQNEAAERLHELTDGERIASCSCGDWHTVSFWVAAERRATVDWIEERLIDMEAGPASEIIPMLKEARRR